jgi:hypothetical protein
MGSHFEHNFAEDGGAIYSVDLNHDMKIEKCSFVGNRAEQNGGAVRIYGDVDRSSIISCNFTGNVAIWNGGGLYIDGNVYNLEVKDCLFVRNEATRFGGGGTYHIHATVFASPCLSGVSMRKVHTLNTNI